MKITFLVCRWLSHARNVRFKFLVGNGQECDYHIPGRWLSHARNVIFTFRVCKWLSHASNVKIKFLVGNGRLQGRWSHMPEMRFLPTNFLIANILILKNTWNRLKMHAGSQGHMWKECKYELFYSKMCIMLECRGEGGDHCNHEVLICFLGSAVVDSKYRS